MMMGWVLAVLIAAEGTLPRPLLPAEKEAIAAVVKEDLRDPESAQLCWPSLRDTNVYCGTINAKNGYGGYVGRRPFAVFIDAVGTTVRPDKPARALIGGQDAQSDRLLYLACSNPEKDGRLDVAPRIGE